ncbi:protein of unknown function [Ruminococcaceae bacterium BL-6]|nr:protein of unknown function [Ruminococcaceae bacterium BL-6]
MNYDYIFSNKSKTIKRKKPRRTAGLLPFFRRGVPRKGRNKHRKFHASEKQAEELILPFDCAIITITF